MSRNFGKKNIWCFNRQLHLARIKFDEMHIRSHAPHLATYRIYTRGTILRVANTKWSYTWWKVALVDFMSTKDVWAPVTGEVLSCEIEDENLFDPYAVAIKKGSEVIGHVPHKISAACFLFLEMSGTLTCEITDSNHQYSFDLPQGGIHIPFKLILKSRDSMLMMKIKWLVQSVPPIECKQTAPSKRKLDSESSQKPSAKKMKALKHQAELPIIDLDSKNMAGPSDHNIAKEIPWVNLGKQTFTTVDKSIIIIIGIVASYLNNLFFVCVQVSN